MASPLGLATMEDFLRQYAGREVFYSPNPGNAGDSLIAAGTYQIFRRVNVPFQIMKNDSPIDGKTVLIGGGGNLVPLYGEARAAIEFALDRASELIILPHTVRGNEDILRRLPKSAIVFCRDAVSYQHVINNTEATVYLDHDMAFHLRVEDFDQWCEQYPDAPALYKKYFNNLAEGIDSATGLARFLRRDGERRNNAPALDNSSDPSLIYEFGTWPDNAEKSVYCLFSAIRHTNFVLTDRLHISIASGLLQKNCILLDNNYGKNESIFLHSMKKLFSTVRLGRSESDVSVLLDGAGA